MPIQLLNHIANGKPVTTFVLQSPDTTKWMIGVTNAGELYSVSGAIGSVTDFKVKNQSSAFVSFAVDNDGAVSLKTAGDTSGTATEIDDLRMRSTDGTIYRIRISTDNIIYSDTDLISLYAPLVIPFTWDILFGTATTSGSGQLSKTTGTGGNWLSVAQNSTPLTGNFVFSGNFNWLNASSQFMLGYRTAIVTSPGAASANITGAMYADGSNMTAYNAATGTGIAKGAPPVTKSFEISRVGSIITFKYDGIARFTATNSGTIYITAQINNVSTDQILNASFA